MLKEQRFDCCFELEHKGIYFEVENNQSHVSFAMFYRHEVETEVCLRIDDVDKLISLLQQFKSSMNQERK